MPDTQLNELISGDAVAYSIEKCRFMPDETQKRILRSQSRYIICDMHRQFGKTSIIAIKALHYSYYHADSLCVISSPTEDQSKEMLRNVYRWLRPLDLLLEEESKKSITFAHNAARIVALSGAERTIRGKSAPDMVIIDEASRTPDEVFVALSPMLMMSQGQLILISTPHGKQGEFFRCWTGNNQYSPEEWASIHDEWERYQITAEENPRLLNDPECMAWLAREKARLSPRAYRQEYMCEFVEAEDNVFSYDDIQRAMDDSVQPLFELKDDDSVKPLFETRDDDDVQPLG